MFEFFFLVAAMSAGEPETVAAQDDTTHHHDMPAGQKPPTPPAEKQPAHPEHGTQPHQDAAPASPATQTEADHPDDDAMMDMSGADMTGVLGPYAMTREASGTSWQPDATPHNMGHEMHGDWMVMGHLLLNAVYDWQDGPRGDEKAFVSGMLMASARRGFENGDVINLRAMLSPDPFMGKGGYPLLLASGETANGVTPLIDRQHPHDLFMELSASYSFALGQDETIFFYAGLPGEPAFGPPAFMHRLSTGESPEAPITHHWLDSTHITYGVLTAGWVKDAWKIELSRFKGREPDQDRFDIESPKLDSTAARVSWNPTENWALQISWADQKSPEQLEPDIDVTRLSASAIYTVALADVGWWSTTLAWGFKDPTEGETTNAFALESAYAPNRDWTMFARAEAIESHELSPSGAVETVGKISVGAIRDFHLADNLRVGVGALYTVNFVPEALEPSYDGDPDGAMVFLRLAASN